MQSSFSIKKIQKNCFGPRNFFKELFSTFPRSCSWHATNDQHSHRSQQNRTSNRRSGPRLSTTNRWLVFWWVFSTIFAPSTFSHFGTLDSSPDPERTLALMVPVRDPTLASSSLGLDQQLTPLLPTKQINGTLPSYNTMRVAPMLNPDHGKTINNF